MDKKNWELAFDVYNTYSQLSFDEFITKLDTLSLSGDIRKMLVDLKSSEQEAFHFFERFEENIEQILEPPIPESLGAWKVKTLIETGGMSSVYLAERNDDQFRMKAAVKFIHFSGYSPQVIRRFRQEMQFLATLDHPNITRIIDSGITEYGTPWYVMEYVDGMPVHRYCNEHALSLRERLRLFRDICRALQHAHKNLIIHRDLKPSNILVTREGRVKLLDFGIAKALSNDRKFPDGSPLTRDNQSFMTPEYASPEQLEGRSVNISSDIYSLGVILHELLTGQRPFSFEGMTRVEMVNTLNSRTPVAPGTVFAHLSGKPPGLEKARLDREIDDILLTALRAEPERRYDSVEQFSRDIDNYLNRKPVMARADSKRYRLKKFIQRNRTGVVLGSLAVVFLLAGILAFVWQARQTQLEAERAIAATERVVAVKDFLERMITATNPWTHPDQPLTARDMIEQGARSIEDELGDQPDLAAELLGVIGASYQGMREDALAGQYLGRAMDLIEQGARLDPVTEADIRAYYAGALLRSGEPGTAETLVTEALETVTFSDDERTPGVRSRLLSMRANARSLLGDPAGALQNAAEAADLVCSVPGAYTLQCINTQMDLRHFYEWAGDFGRGLEAAEFAYRLADTTQTVISDPVRLAVTGNYGNALSYNARTEEAIPLLQQNVKRALDLYGDESYRYARALYDLTSAYIYAGRTHEALPRAIEVFETGGTSQPGNPMNSYWLHQVFHLAVDLHRPDLAEEMFARFEEYLPDRMSRYYEDAFRVERGRIRVLRHPDSPGVLRELEQMLGEFRENGSPQLAPAALLAARQAVNTEHPEAAGNYLEEFHQSLGAIPRSDIRPARAKLLEARRLALSGHNEQAIDTAGEALVELRELGHRESPFVAEAEAVLAGLYCRNGQTTDGRAALERSIRYWQETAGVPGAVNTMKRLAGGCD